MQDTIKIKIPGRICLLGDKIDLIGLPVIAVAIDRYLELTITKIPGNIIKMKSDSLNVELTYEIGSPWNTNNVFKYWLAIIERLKEKISGFDAYITGNLPIGAGLSSSAAFSIALIEGLNSLYDLKLNKFEIAELAYLAEHDDLGIMCGRMDQYSIACGGASFIETDFPPKVECLDVQELPLVIADSQEPRQAKKILNSIKQRLNDNDSVVHDAFKIVYDCVLKGKKALLEKDFISLGQLMNIQQEQENIIGAATPKLNSLCQAALQAGALGAKQMGAGGGGCIVALCPGKQKEVYAALESAGSSPMILKIFNY
jgi:mevalonate kinase